MLNDTLITPFNVNATKPEKSSSSSYKVPLTGAISVVEPAYLSKPGYNLAHFVVHPSGLHGLEPTPHIM